MNWNLDLAMELADLADEISMSRFRAQDLAVEKKQDGSLVTDADRAVEIALRALLERKRPSHAIVGEEMGGNGDAECRWYLDPIDGTTRFAAGVLGWYTLIALARGDDVILGVASAPSQNRRWWAAHGAGAFCNGQCLSVSRTSRLANATVNDDWRHTLASGVRDHPLAKLATACAHVRPYQGHSHLAIAQGLGDIALGIGGHVWDHAPMKIIVEEAGGRFTDLDGRESIDSGHALVSNGRLHAEALRLLGQADRTKVAPRESHR